MRPRRGAHERENLSTETIAAVDGTVTARLKRNLAGLPAFRTDGIEHSTGAAATAVAGVALTGIAAGLTTLGLIGKALLCEELLLTGSKGELLTAILAGDSFVLKHVIPLLC